MSKIFYNRKRSNSTRTAQFYDSWEIRIPVWRVSRRRGQRGTVFVRLRTDEMVTNDRRRVLS